MLTRRRSADGVGRPTDAASGATTSSKTDWDRAHRCHRRARSLRSILGVALTAALGWTLGGALSGCTLISSSRITTPADVSPQVLDVAVAVNERVNTKDLAHPMTQMSLVFEYQGAAVLFAHDEQVVCDGIVLDNPSTIQFVSGRIPAKRPEEAYRCDYTAGRDTASLLLPVLAVPELIASQAGAHIAREQHFALIYTAADGTTMRGSADNGPETAGVDGGQQRDTGTYTGLDTSKLHTGSGTVGLYRNRMTRPQSTFHSARLESEAVTLIPVTWT
jgi:hypothetical protein